MAVFPFPQLAELREKYTYNITPFPTSVKSNGRFVLYVGMWINIISEWEHSWFYLVSGTPGSWESDDDAADMDDEDSVVTALGCLGPLGGLLAPELQRYQKHLKGRCNSVTAAKWFETNRRSKSSCSALNLTVITNSLSSVSSRQIRGFLLIRPLFQRGGKKANSLTDLVKNAG